MRLLFSLTAAAALLLGSAPAHAFNIQFGAATNNTSCSTGGNSGDRSCTSSASINNGALDATASLNIRGQASADHGITTNPDAFADITVSYDIPYTITRTVEVSAPFTMSIPVLQLTFNANYSGTAAHDSTQVGGGWANANAGFGATLSDVGGGNLVFGSTSYSGSTSSGASGSGNNPFNDGSPDPTATLTGDYQGNVGEINLFSEVPTDFQAWSDSVASYANGGNFPAGNYITQTYSDVIRVSFRLRAESRPQGSVSTTGGEAIACAGLSTTLGGFSLNPNCGSGFNLTASLSQTGTFDFTVPEPSTMALLGASLFGLVWMGRRVRKD